MNTTQKQAARKFVECWTFRRGSEKGEDQQFWNSLLGEVLGMEDVASRVQFQVPVPMKNSTKFLDAWIPETRVLIEHKSRGVNLDMPQSGHDGLTPYEQAVEYDNARPFDEKARWIVTCNFDEFRIYDRAKPLAPPLLLKLGNLPKEAYRLAFLVNPKETAIDRELEISVQAGRIVGEIYDALLKQYNGGTLLSLRGDSESRSLGEDSKKHPSLPNSKTPSSESNYLAALNRLCVRLVFCLYAEDAEIFPKDCFRRLVEASDARRLRIDLQRLFHTLDTPDGSHGTKNERDLYLEPELCTFPYTNGGLFRNAAANDIPPLTEEIRQLLIGASQFDWRDITPTIFGALFESTLNPVTRRSGGMVYTSVENIHKVIDPLFLDNLTRRVEAAIHKGDKRTLLALQTEMAALTFLDPACGSGNFLTETYICLRRLENRIIAALQRGQREFDLGLSVKVSIAQFFGLEINDFAVAVAKTALWIAEAQMLRETAEILHREPDYLPLHDYANIVEGNALRMDWPCTNYIMGNPPFVGFTWMSKEQRDDMAALFPNNKNIDLVCGWYKKASDHIRGTNTRCAFVSTNSITQGEQVATLWKNIDVEIGFAHRTFRWDNEALDKAHVHCVIIGFYSKSPAENAETARSKTIFDGDTAIPASHINGYLIDGDEVYAERRGKPISAEIAMTNGNKPVDGGHLIVETEGRGVFMQTEPESLKYMKRLIGSRELINRLPRWCLWLKGVSPVALRDMPLVMERIRLCKTARLASRDEAARKLADTPTLFRDTRNPKTAIVIPEVSSESRRYIPMDFIDDSVICTNKIQMIPDATIYHFGILTSSVHMAWTRAVCGRMKSDYSYSKDIVYNNFVWPDAALSASLREKIFQTAQVILDVRKSFMDADERCSLAVLYDATAMPPELLKAHQANDRAVLAAYGLAADTPESEIVAHLFKLYAEKVAAKE